MIRRVLKRLKAAIRGGAPAPVIWPSPDRIVGHAHARMMLSVRLYARDGNGRRGYVVLAPGVYLGRHVELATALGGDLFVGRDVSIQDGCVVQGDVTIGSHTLFGANVMIATTTHRFRDNPAWLIRDQDEAVATAAVKPADHSRPVLVEEDCWLGWGAVVMPGVTVGRGAVVGANCVVTRDIGPYEIHGGSPNRLLGKRLEFQPPRTISSANGNDLPYFYRGFHLAQKDLANAADQGIAAAQAHAILVLAGSGADVEIEGTVTGNPLQLAVSVNGGSAQTHQLPAGRFSLRAVVGNEGRGILAPFTIVELVDCDHADPADLYESNNRYAIRLARIA